MEALVIGDPWRQLFTAEEISAAERRLQELDYAP
jgi:hypothetical protein